MACSKRTLRLLLAVFYIGFLNIKTTLGLNISDTAYSNLTVHFYPDEIEGLVVEKTTDVYFTVEPGAGPTGAAADHVHDAGFMLRIESADTKLATIVGESEIWISLDSNSSVSSQNYSFTVKGKFLGRTKLLLYRRVEETSATGPGPLQQSTGAPFGESALLHQWDKLDVDYQIAVIREERIIDVLFIAFVSIFVIMSNIGMGCKIDVQVVKDVLRRPVSPVIGFFCQFVVMPSLAYGLTKSLALSGGTGLGFFATGCAPGGGASNMYTFLFDADVSLSVTMTLVSVVTAFGMIPLWLLTLGQKILDDTEGNIKIPYQNILISLATITIPVGIGILIQKKKPSWAKKIVRCLTPFFVFFILFMCTAGVYSNLYLFSLFSFDMVIACILLPWCGFALGGILAAVFRQPKLRILAIAIETGIQNTGIPIILTKYSLPQPEADLSVVAPVMVAIFTPVPLWLALGVLEVRKRCFKKPAEFKEVETEDNELNNPEVDSNENETLVENGSAAAKNAKGVDTTPAKHSNSSL